MRDSWVVILPGSHLVTPFQIASSAGRDLSITDTLSAASTRRGTFTFEEDIVYLEHGVTGYPGPACDQGIFVNGGVQVGHVTITIPAHLYTWQCRIVSRGSGFIKPGSTHLLDFWIRQETAVFENEQGMKRVHNPRNVLAPAVHGSVYPLDLGIPAVPGTYSMKSLLRWDGLTHVKLPPAFRLHLTVTYHP